ncbi:uncharacterized protein LOC111638993, partial [Centruroides sculpturatus]|uniref:uncharacterized protein LOC111638993 n=1 Tax=Centruroides sculpturatus TaxID=218467 RepID=UPI000C6CDB6F
IDCHLTVKILHKFDKSNPKNEMDRFIIRELAVIRILHHPNIIKFIKTIETSKRHHICRISISSIFFDGLSTLLHMHTKPARIETPTCGCMVLDTREPTNLTESILEATEAARSTFIQYIIMELAQRRDLLEIIKRNKTIDKERTCRWFHHLIDGIDYCHNKTREQKDLYSGNSSGQLVPKRI